MSVIDFNKEGSIGTNLKPKRYDIEIYQGDTFSFNLVLKDGSGNPLTITGWTGLAQIKKVSDSSPGETPSLTVTNEGAGTFKIALTDTETGALDGDTEYKYDVQVTDNSGNKRTYIGGKITVTEDISE